MEAISSAVAWFLGLGSTVIVPIVLIILGLVFRVGFAKAVRGGVTTTGRFTPATRAGIAFMRTDEG